jgi:hypothetical protein
MELDQPRVMVETELHQLFPVSLQHILVVVAVAHKLRLDQLLPVLVDLGAVEMVEMFQPDLTA